MNYAQVLDYLYTCLPMYTRIGKAAYKADLDNTIALLDVLGNPHHQLKCIHIAGTNGKGSTSHMMASILQEAGYKTGLYTSPHLLDYRERLKINGVMIEEDYIIQFVERNKEKFDAIQPSFFEWTVALCFQYFYDKKVEVAVIETGLGGRLDSTNVILPDLSIITNIGYDHMDLLGDTLQKIAAEKAGIIKYKTPVVIGETGEETKDVFIQKAAEQQSKIYFADEMIPSQNVIFENGKLEFDIYINHINKYRISSPLAGFYQTKNIATVVQSVSVLQQLGYAISEKNIIEGILKTIENTGLLGRWQILSNQPLTVCDTAHNTHGLAEIVRQLDRIQKQHLHMVIGMVADKDISGVLSLLPKENTTYYFCKAQLPRALNEEALALQARPFGLTGTTFPTVPLAYEAAKKSASQKDMIYIGGSTFVVGDLLAYLK